MNNNVIKIKAYGDNSSGIKIGTFISQAPIGYMFQYEVIRLTKNLNSNSFTDQPIRSFVVDSCSIGSSRNIPAAVSSLRTVVVVVTSVSREKSLSRSNEVIRKRNDTERVLVRPLYSLQSVCKTGINPVSRKLNLEVNF